MTDIAPPIAWLLLRDGHFVPIVGLSPDELKQASKQTVRRAERAIGHVSTLNAILHQLGFEGDIAGHSKTGWAQLQEFMGRHAIIGPRRDLFTGELLMSSFRQARRALADRLTLGPRPLPTRVFLAVDYDWSAWEREWDGSAGWTDEDENFVPSGPREARRWAFWNRHMTMGMDNFLGDQLFGSGERVLVRAYFSHPSYEPQRHEAPRNLERVTRAMMHALSGDPRGWVSILPYNERLIFLRAEDGSYDLVWRNLRDAAPDEQAEAGFRARLERRQDVWLEKWEHEGELRWYADGGGAYPFPGYDTVLERHLEALGIDLTGGEE